MQLPRRENRDGDISKGNDKKSKKYPARPQEAGPPRFLLFYLFAHSALSLAPHEVFNPVDEARNGCFDFLPRAGKICLRSVVGIFHICAFWRLWIERAHHVDPLWRNSFGQQSINVAVIHGDEDICSQMIRT